MLCREDGDYLKILPDLSISQIGACENGKLSLIHEHLAFFEIFGPVDLIKIRDT